ncbi:MAG: DUF6884 domain-containing protein [Verrucomicrobiota bacterium]
MKTIVLISCASKKVHHKTNAKDLYISPLFAGNLRYARSLKPDGIFILSAKHGLLGLDEEIEPYNTTLKDMPPAQIKAWANKVVEQLKGQADLQSDHFIFLAGEKYRKHLAPHLASYEVPLRGMPIGKQLKYLATQAHEPNLP